MNKKTDVKLPEGLSETHKREILTAIKNNTPIIISGEQGPTGKTYLKEMLVSQNILAFEEWECTKITLSKSICSELL